MPGESMRFLRVIIYKLKRQYGGPVDIYRATSTLDTKTGLKAVNKTVYKIKYAVIMPTEMSRKANPFNKEFSYGGMYDPKLRDIIIDNNDIPKGVFFDLDDYVILNNQRYEIKNISRPTHNLATFLTIREVEGQQPGEVHTINLFDSLRFTHVPTRS